jgi:molybdate transport system ATP-binding protein
LLRLLAGTLQPDSGRIELGGRPYFDSRKGIRLPSGQRPVSTVLQHGNPVCSGTVNELLVFAYQGAAKRRRLLKPGYFVDALELGEIMDRRHDRLSDGERQRVDVAKAILGAPDLLLLDEAFTILGQNYRDRVLSVIKSVQKESGMAVLYASQSLGEIIELTDHVAILDDGRIIRTGSLKSLAKEQGILRYLGMNPIDNLVSLRIDSHDLEGGCTVANLFGLPFVLPLRRRLPVGRKVEISVRSSDIALAKSHIAGISIQNQIKGRVCALIPSGDKIFVQIDCGVTLLAEITSRAFRAMSLKEGDTVYCLIKAHAARYTDEIDAHSSRNEFQCSDGGYIFGSTRKQDISPGINF